jgi:hypothetical protein
VLVKKKDGGIRFCCDYRSLNKVTIKDNYPLPLISEVLDTLGGYSYFSTLDALSGYWQIPLEEESKAKTAFITRDGLFEWEVMPFGVSNAPSSFQRAMDKVLHDLKWKSVLVYIDDIIIFSKTFEEHLKHLNEVFARLAEANIVLKPSKCKLFQERVVYLGHVISKDGIAIDESKLEPVKNFPTPKNVKSIQKFLGLVGYYRKFIKDFSKIAHPLFQLLKKNVKFNWSNECDEAFKILKNKLIEAPILVLPNFDKPFQLFTDASGTGLGAVLEQDGKVVAYISRSLKPSEKNYTVYEKEALALVWSIKKLKQYLHGRKFDAFVDNGPVAWFATSKFQNSSERIKRWILAIQEENCTINYRKGKENINADALSRMFEVNTVKKELVMDLDTIRKAQDDPEVMDYAKKNGFEMIDGILYLVENRNDTLVKRIFIPKSLRKKVMEAYHDNFGHFGYAKTLNFIKNKYYWPKFRKEIENYVATCESCGVKKGAVRKVGTLAPIPVGEAFEMVGMDIVGPLTETNKGNKYILVISDYLTKYPEAFAMKDISAESVAKILVEEVAMRYGPPKKILSDQGKNFRAKISNYVYKLLNSKKLSTTPYHPQTDGLVERFNKTLIKMISHYVDEEHKDWDEYLPYVLYAYRCAENATTKFAPFELMYGRKPRMPIDIALEGEVEKTWSEDEYGSKVTKGIKLLHDQAKENISKAQLTQKMNYDKNRLNAPEYKVGDKVMVYVPPRKHKGLTTKFLDKWEGPYTITSVLGQNNVVVEISVKNRKTFNIDKVKLYKERKEETELEVVPVEFIKSYKRKKGYKRMTYYKFKMSDGTTKTYSLKKLSMDPIAKELAHGNEQSF